MFLNLFNSVLIITAALGCYSRSIPLLEPKSAQVSSGVILKTSRSSDTCADPSLARTMFEGFSGTIIAHIISFHYGFVNANTALGSAFWTLQGPAFRAWPTQQPFTVPLFGMGNPSGTDTIYMVGPDAETPPVVGGFNTGIVIVAWVYDTPVCGSVPLMSAVFASQTDHYYTIDLDEHAGLLTLEGWEDGGVVAFVLPLS